MRAFTLSCCLLWLSQAALAQVTTTEIDFATPNLGGVSVETTGSSFPLQTGQGQIKLSASTAPSGVAIIGLRANDVLVTEAGIPAVLPILSGRTFVEVNGPVNTGIAFANPTSFTVFVSFHMTNQLGVDFGPRSFTLGPNAQLAAFLTEAPFNVSGTVLGTLTFNAGAPIAVTALRGLTNTRNEFLITSQTVTALPTSFIGETVVMPHFADGGGWQTQVILVNPSDDILTGTVQFFGQGSPAAPAGPVAVNVDGLLASSFNYTVQSRSSVRLRTLGTSFNIQAGSVRVTPAGGSRSPAGFLVFSFASGGITVTEAAVPVLRPALSLRMFVESTKTIGTPNSIQSGIAITNTSLTPATINVELTTQNGISLGPAVFFTVPGNGHIATFLHELFPTLLLPFRGILRISSGVTPIVVAGLRTRYNERGDFLVTTTPPSNEGGQATTADLVFPQIVDGEGYTTQFLLFSGVLSQNTMGKLRFLTKTGSPMLVTIK